MKKYILALPILMSVILLSNCTNNNTTEITNTIQAFYGKPNEYLTSGINYLSDDLNTLIKQADKKTELSAERIKKSEYPTDKPAMIEGDIFTSLYEGQNKFTILKIDEKADSAFVLITFENTYFDTTKWNDEIVLINKNGWKIDNVNYIEAYGDAKNLKNLLRNFINAKD